jgi:hypothetical protein
VAAGKPPLRAHDTGKVKQPGPPAATQAVPESNASTGTRATGNGTVAVAHRETSCPEGVVHGDGRRPRRREAQRRIARRGGGKTMISRTRRRCGSTTRSGRPDRPRSAGRKSSRPASNRPSRARPLRRAGMRRRWATQHSREETPPTVPAGCGFSASETEYRACRPPTEEPAASRIIEFDTAGQLAARVELEICNVALQTV